jgi:hypothetical protein
MSDVDVPRTWSLQHQGYFWSGTGPAAVIKGQYTIPIFGAEIKWKDGQAREYWGGIVGDPEFTYPDPGFPERTGPGDEHEYPPPLSGDNYPSPTSISDEPRRFCPHCGAPNMGSWFCPQCGNRVN